MYFMFHLSPLALLPDPPTTPIPSSPMSSLGTPVSPMISSPSYPMSPPTDESCNEMLFDDIGLLLKSTPQSSSRCLSSTRKYSILSNHFRPTINFKFPSRFLDGCQRSCQFSYLDKNPWFVYSKEEDGIFCLPCVLFANKDNLGQFVCDKFNYWTAKSSKFSKHISTKYHQFAVTQAEALKSSHLRPESSIDNQIKGIRVEQIAKNRSILKHIADAIHVCGTQNIALRGHRDDSTADPNSNKGTFLAILQYGIRSGDTVLANHFREAGKNATYTIKTIQNNLIQIIGDCIRDKILDEIKQAKFYSILCDEVTDKSGKEQVSIVLRFVDSNNIIREEFLDFITTARINSEMLAFRIKETLTKYCLDFQDCRGQGYDGASNMSARRGVQGLLIAENSKATYVHRSSHVLNLCIVQACSLTSIRNMNGAVTESAYFFENSSKRQAFFESIIDKQSKIVKVKDMCRTRWIYRHEAY